MLSQVPNIRSQIPHGVQDRFLVEAARRRRAEAALSTRFVQWGYQEVIPPTFEYLDNLAVGANVELQQAMYRFFDREGHTLALRADFTPQMARIAATKLYDRPMPLRFFYVGSVFRLEEPQAGRKREFTQAGVELIGAHTPAADAEVVALAIAALEVLELRDFQVNLGQMAFFHALVDGLPADDLAPIRDAIDHKNVPRLVGALAAAGVTGSQHSLLRCLPDLIGGPELLDQVRALSAGLARAAEALSALDRLAVVYRLLEAYGVADRVILDLGEIRGMDYYTGITFRGVAPGLGWPIVSGGRYDDLIAHFGRPLSAVGFGLGIERALLVQGRYGATGPSIAADALLSTCARHTCLALVQELRKRGCRIEIDPLGLEPALLAVRARQQGIPRTLCCTEGGWLLTDVRGEQFLTPAELRQEADRWISGQETNRWSL
jgi:ATP phosphoribosyltransferase regulatory subunit